MFQHQNDRKSVRLFFTNSGIYDPIASRTEQKEKKEGKKGAESHSFGFLSLVNETVGLYRNTWKWILFFIVARWDEPLRRVIWYGATVSSMRHGVRKIWACFFGYPSLCLRRIFMCVFSSTATIHTRHRWFFFLSTENQDHARKTAEQKPVVRLSELQRV